MLNSCLVSCLSFLLVGSSVRAFLPQHVTQHPVPPTVVLQSKKDKDDGLVKHASFGVGTFIEFAEKKHTERIHVGTVTKVQHKANGGALYDITDSDNKQYQNVADKAIQFVMNPPNSPGPAQQLFREFCAAQTASVDDLQTALEISPELLELAWEEATADADPDHPHEITPDSLITLCHSHTASNIETYQAWRLLQSDLSHIFFKEIKDHGRIASFKAKARKTVDTAKRAFCIDPQQAHHELCLL